jgi:hydrogenase maturation protease
MQSQTYARVAIIAYGNPLRSDDGIGWHVAQLLLGELSNFETEIISVHQLTPELAEQAARASGVIFIDASRTGEPGKIVYAPVQPNDGGELFSHSLGPAQMLALCEQLYGTKPEAFTVSIAGRSFEYGDALSGTLQDAVPALVATVKELVVRLAVIPTT